ncbi:MAG: Tat pathway signal sequence domain protein [Actinobacteria bacterium]|nr:Tat pathway signal sequence domain protein [Actinomycetota bacterium]
MAFTVAVDPEQTTYLSVKLWGEDFAPSEQEWRLQLFIDGKVVGWFDQGPVDNLDQYSTSPRLPGQFYLHTIPLPETLTAGKRSLEVEIRAMGRIWSYGSSAAGFYKTMTGPSRPIYAAYTHTTAFFLPDASDPFGAPTALSTRADDSEAAIQLVHDRVVTDLKALLFAKPGSSIDPWAWMTLVHGYGWEPGPAYQQPRTLVKICEAIDANYLAWKKDPKVLTASGQQWLGFGRVGLALDQLWTQLEPLLDQSVTAGTTAVPNPGFEVGTAGWSVTTWRGTGAVTADPSVARTGDASLKVTADPNGTSGSVVGVSLGAPSRPIIGSGSYRVSVWCRTEALAAPGAYLDVLYYTDSGTLVKGDQKFFAATGTHDWQELSATLPTPAGATRMRIDLRVEGSGTAWFDDVGLDLVAGDPPASGDLPARRTAYREMLLASRDYWRQNQRHYTNQVQFTSSGIYLCNKGLQLLSPADAWPEETARTWIYEAVGLAPLSSGENADGSKKWKLGHDYHLYTQKGLSRELGYVGGYGEILADLLTSMYEMVTTGQNHVVDDALRAQIEKVLTTRGWFRHEGADTAGNRVMKLETIIGWRNEHYPGEVDYAVPVDKDINPVQVAAAFPTAELVGWTQQMIEEGQFGPMLGLLHTDLSSRVGHTAARFIMKDLPAFRAQVASSRRLPATWGSPDFLFTDETDGVVALKRGDELLYVSLYWRARQAVNRWSRVHLLRPDLERSATVRCDVEFGADGPAGTFTVQDWVCWDYAINDSDGNGLVPGGWTPPGETLHQAYAGEVLQIARTPADMDPALGATTLGVESIEVGRAPFYTLSYAGYLIAMNTTADQTFSWKAPGTGTGIDCATGQRVALPRRRRIGPGETVVLFDATARR